MSKARSIVLLLWISLTLAQLVRIVPKYEYTPANLIDEDINERPHERPVLVGKIFPILAYEHPQDDPDVLVKMLPFAINLVCLFVVGNKWTDKQNLTPSSPERATTKIPAPPITPSTPLPGANSPASSRHSNTGKPRPPTSAESPRSPYSPAAAFSDPAPLPAFPRADKPTPQTQ